MKRTVVKVGGSLFDLPDLGERLRRYLLTSEKLESVLLIPGGGAAADVVRQMQKLHGFDDRAAHHAAIQAMSLNAYWLAGLLGIEVVSSLPTPPGIRFFDAVPSADIFPATWDVTSDAIALQVAQMWNADELILLKSVTRPTDADGPELAALGLVDAVFGERIEEWGRAWAWVQLNHESHG